MSSRRQGQKLLQNALSRKPFQLVFILGGVLLFALALVEAYDFLAAKMQISHLSAALLTHAIGSVISLSFFRLFILTKLRYFIPAFANFALAWIFWLLLAKERPLEINYLFFASVFLVPLAEEVFFRGGLTTLFQNILGNAFWGTILSAYFFSFLHSWPRVNSPAEWGFSIGPFLLAIFAEWLKHSSRSLWPAIVFHSSANFFVLLCGSRVFEFFGLSFLI